uniref:Sulfur reduction protein DsrE n=1 Tax=Caldimicrobium thiodismutans TaxID=1653476 RepID=A0A832LV93_9BACT
MSYKVCFLIANRPYISDGIRSALGLAVENMYSFTYIFYQKMPAKTEYLEENLAWIRDMEGDVFAVSETMDEETKNFNLQEWGLTEASIDDVVEKILECDIIVGYGPPAQKVQAPPQCA